MDSDQFYKHKIDFLYKAIDDAQNTIRFTDTKGAAVMGFWAIVVTSSVNTRNDWIAWIQKFTAWYDRFFVYVLLFMLVLFVIQSIWLVFAAVHPKTAPHIHINKGAVKTADLYYLHQIVPSPNFEQLFLDDSSLKLHAATEQYQVEFDSIDPQHLQNELIFELQKVSFIRNLKILRVNAALAWLKRFVLTFLVLLLFWFIGVKNLNGGNLVFPVDINVQLFIVLYVAHKIADYLFQTDFQAKNKHNLISPLLLHCLIYTAIVLGFAYIFVHFFNWTAVFILFFSHLLLDQRKFEEWWARTIKKIDNPSNAAVQTTMMELDQAFHYAVLFLISLI